MTYGYTHGTSKAARSLSGQLPSSPRAILWKFEDKHNIPRGTLRQKTLDRVTCPGRSKISPDDEAVIVAYITECKRWDFSDTEIGQALGTSQSAIGKWRQIHGIPKLPRVPKPATPKRQRPSKPREI